MIAPTEAEVTDIAAYLDLWIFSISVRNPRVVSCLISLFQTFEMRSNTFFQRIEPHLNRLYSIKGNSLSL